MNTSLATSDVQPTYGFGQPAAHQLLARLRFLGRTCRARARIDAYGACAMLSSDPAASAQAYADALLRVLGQGFGRSPVLYAPGNAELSFDERWLLSLIDAVMREDIDSLRFLTVSKIPRHLRRQVAWLAARLVDRLAEPDDKTQT